MNAKQRAALGAERAKYLWRNREIMSDNGMNSYADLATTLGISAETVRRTVIGTLHSYVVLDWLRNHGQSEKHLCDPRRA